METETSPKTASLSDKLSQNLKLAQQEIEELIVQFSLGKAEATDKFEEIKKEFNTRVHNLKEAFTNPVSDNHDKVAMLKSKFEELQVQLALGKAEAKDVFHEQHQNILKTIHEIQTELTNHKGLNEFNDEFKSEVEKFKIKLEILKLKFELKKFETKDEFKDAMTDAKIKIDKLSVKVEEKWDATKKKYSDVGNEIDLAFDHLMNAVSKLKEKL